MNKKFIRITLRLSLLLLILLFIALLNIVPHFGYKYPLHIDEWRHLALARDMIHNDNIYKYNLEKGFTYFLFFLDKSGVDLLFSYRYLPIVFVILTSVLLFLTLYALTKKYYIALLAVIFFASLKSNVNILGPWFFTPLSFCFPFIYLFFLFFVLGIEKKSIKLLIVSVLDYIFILFVHPVSATFIFPIILIYVLIHYKVYIKNRFVLGLLMLIPVISFLIFLDILWKGNLKRTLFFIIKFITFEKGWGVYEKLYSVPSFYTYTSTFFAFIGSFFAIKNRKTRIFVIWVLVTLFGLWFFHRKGFSFLVPYQRMFYYTLLGLVPLSAIGFYYSLRFISNTIKRNLNFSYKKAISLVVFSLISIFTFYSIFNNYFTIPEDIKLYKLIDDYDYKALKFLEKQGKGKVLALPEIATTVYPISGKRALATLRFEGTDSLRNEIRDFYKLDCEKKKRFIKRFKIKYVYSHKPIDCNWDLIYSNKRYIYKV